MDVRVENAIITAMAYSSDSLSQATANAGKVAGGTAMSIISEPLAAAHVYGIKMKEGELTV